MGIDVLLASVIGTAAVTLSLMFLPAVIELSRPKDAGPRFIPGSIAIVRIAAITNLDEETHLETPLATQLFNFLRAIPSLEAELI
jgi:hypothetical protein